MPALRPRVYDLSRLAAKKASRERLHALEAPSTNTLSRVPCQAPDDPVQKYLPASVRMPTRHGKQITLLHLASHQSGLPREATNLAPRTWRDPYAEYTVEQLCRFLSTYKPRRDPGAQFEYSNVGVALLGHVIALKAGQDYESLVVERPKSASSASRQQNSTSPPTHEIPHALFRVAAWPRPQAPRLSTLNPHTVRTPVAG